MAEVEKVNARLEDAALTTARAPSGDLRSLERGVRGYAPRRGRRRGARLSATTLPARRAATAERDRGYTRPRRVGLVV